MDFVGTGRRLTQGDVGEAARLIKIETSVMLSILEVEAAGRGFDSRNRPKILPERHKFYEGLGNTPARKAAVASGLAYPKWGTKPYPKTSDGCYALLDDMRAIDHDEALEATSWGLPQILGSNHLSAGFGDVDDMVTAFMQGEREQLFGMAVLIQDWNLDETLRGKDFTQASSWVAFAKRYNGPGYARNDYHNKLATAYRKHSKGEPLILPALEEAVLRKGMKGEAVRNLQADLAARGFDPGPVDGRFGDKTVDAVKAFQRWAGLEDDGIAGPMTLKRLEEPNAAEPAPKPETWPGQDKGGGLVELLVALLVSIARTIFGGRNG